VAPCFVRAAEMDPHDLADAFAPLEERARADLDDPRLARSADMRYLGQSYELTVPAEDLSELERLFHAAHEQRYSYRMEGEPVEIVALRVMATRPRAEIELREEQAAGDPVESTRRALFNGSWLDVPVVDRSKMGAGSEVRGPCIVELDGSTCVVGPEWAGAVDDSGTLVLEQR
jgi:N-methylhydantoinase A